MSCGINPMQIRRGKEFYADKAEEAVSLYKEGKSIKEVAQRLGVSYSAAYHWVRGIRKPGAGNVAEFISFLESRGPSAAVHILPSFRKHNELFLIASRRGLSVKRVYLGKAYKELATWYYLPGQEKELEKRIEDAKRKVEEFRDRMKKAIE